MTESLKTKVSVNISRPSYGDGRKMMSISIQDEISGAQFCEVEIPYDEFVVALTSGMGYGVAELRGLDVLGKRREHKSIEFPFDSSKVKYKERENVAYNTALFHCPEGWAPSKYFGSQSSFGKNAEGVPVARCSIYRYVETTEEERLNERE